VLERLWPSLAVRLAEYWFFRPGKRFAALATSNAEVTFEVEVRGVPVTVAGWGRGPRVVAMHGWAGGGAQFELLRRAIVEAGFSFFTYDAPAHGGTGGTNADVGVFSDVLAAVAEHLGQVHAVVGHSLGATAAALCASRGLSLQGMVMIAPMPSVEFALDGFATLVGLTRATRERLERRAIERAGLRPDETSLRSLGCGAPAVLLVHDLSDRMVPVEQSEQLAQHWPHARLVTTERRGHNRVLSDATVAEATTRFLLELHKPRISALDRQLGELDAVVF
jgi:pimeloyl-ACP methyl ester carboxylesterase